MSLHKPDENRLSLEFRSTVKLSKVNQKSMSSLQLVASPADVYIQHFISSSPVSVSDTLHASSNALNSPISAV